MWHETESIRLVKQVHQLLAIIISRCGFRIKTCHRNKPNKSKGKLELYICYFHCKSFLKQLCISNKIECHSYKVGYGVLCIVTFKIRAGLGYR